MIFGRWLSCGSVIVCVVVWLCCWMEVSVVGGGGGGGGACESGEARVLVQNYEDDK